MSCSRFGCVALLTTFASLTGCAGAPASSRPSPSTAALLAGPTPFPQEDAETALSAVRPGLRTCRRNAGSTPVVFEAKLEFEPSGKVGRVLIAPGGPVADCVRSDLTQVEIPKFDGPPVEIQMEVTL